MNEPSSDTGRGGTLRRDLEAQRRQVVGELQRCLARIRQVESRGSDADTCEDDPRDVDAGVIDILNATVRRIDVALERLARGDYGLCTRCRRPISEVRLRAMPFAVRCQGCEATRETHATTRRPHARTPPWMEETHDLTGRSE